MISNYRDALEDFEAIVEKSSKEEAAPKAAGLLVLEEFSKYAVGKVTDYTIGLVPKGGGVVKEVLGLGKSIAEAIDKEKNRSAKASESNVLKDFISDLRVNQISPVAAKLESTMTEAIVGVRLKYLGLPTSERKNFRKSLELKNKLLTEVLESAFSVKVLFTRIVEAWINQVQAPGKKYPARVIVKLGKDWNVISAYVDAPRGSRIAEQLLKHGKGRVDLTTLGVPRLIIWYPRSDQEGGGLFYLWARVDAGGRIIKLGGQRLAESFFKKFVNLIYTKPIPIAGKLSGHKTV